VNVKEKERKRISKEKIKRKGIQLEAARQHKE
jgi:hypothetical protein